MAEQRYAFRRFGDGSGHPLLFLQHFTGTLDNWDPAVTDPLARGREVIFFENAGVGRPTGSLAHLCDHEPSPRGISVGRTSSL